MSFPFFHQVEQADCGVACLRMIMRYFGKSIPAKEIRCRIDLSRIGTSILSLKNTSKSFGLKAIGVKLNSESLKNVPLPIIFHCNSNHFAVLWKIKNGIFYIADPAAGKLKYSYGEFAKHFFGEKSFGIGLMLAPTERFYQIKSVPNSWLRNIAKTLSESVKTNRRPFLVLFILSIAALLTEISIPFLLKRTIDEGIGQRDIALVWLLVAGQLAIFTGSRVTSSISSWISNQLGLKLSLKAVDDYLVKLVSLPLRFFESRVNADLIQKSFEREQIQQFILQTPITLVLTAINILLFSGLLFWYNHWIFIGFIIVTIFGLLWEYWMLKRRKNVEYDIRSIRSKNNNNLYEIVNGISELKTHNAHYQRVNVWRQTQKEYNALNKRANNLRILHTGGSTIIYQLRDLSITGLCASFVIGDMMTFGTMMTIGLIAGRLSSGLSSVSSSFDQFQQTAISLERSNDVMDEPCDDREGEIEALDGDICLRNISYKYPGEDSRFIFRNFSLTIPLGKRTAIVGPSGCGKTTLLKLLQGLYFPTEGEVMVGSANLSHLKDENWGRICTGVAQQGYIFSETIAHNIALSEKSPDMSRVNEAIDLACLRTLIEKLPLHENTIIGPSGIELSGGEKQRLMIARAIYRSTEIMLLDEATSSLDAETENTIVQNLFSFCKTRTMIIAAHRLSTIKQADQILFMENGQIVEQGTHHSLMTNGGRYATFVAGQQS